MIITVENLTSAALDWAVAKADGCVLFKDNTLNGVWRVWGRNPHPDSALLLEEWSPSTDWAQGGPIIEREYLKATAFPNEFDADVTWQTRKVKLPVFGYHSMELSEDDDVLSEARGDTLLISAMRCFVLYKLGHEVEIPDELCSSKNYGADINTLTELFESGQL